MTQFERRKTGLGFTLIELLIVIVIMGVLATVVLKVMGNMSRDARRVATEEAVFQTVHAIEIYKQYTGGNVPDLITSWDPLTRQTTVNGVQVGPFLSDPPKNRMVAGGNMSAVVDGNAPVIYLGTSTFQYDYDSGSGSGRFIAAFEEGP
jgi:prepilin-type N-terminal cleavage/methylation domain-containing protein